MRATAINRNSWKRQGELQCPTSKKMGVAISVCYQHFVDCCHYGATTMKFLWYLMGTGIQYRNPACIASSTPWSALVSFSCETYSILFWFCGGATKCFAWNIGDCKSYIFWFHPNFPPQMKPKSIQFTWPIHRPLDNPIGANYVGHHVQFIPRYCFC